MSAAVMKIVSPMAKVFLDAEPRACDPRFEAFENERVSFQAAYRLTEHADYRGFVRVCVSSKAGGRFRVRRVMHVPVGFATFPDADEDYERKTPGLYPDLLRDAASTALRAALDQWNSVWIDAESMPCGEHEITVTLRDESGAALREETVRVCILKGCLPVSPILHTRWMHFDCLAEYYRVPVWSDAHFSICEAFIRHAASQGVNMMLVPVHTPPLDTRVGGERPTCQLADIRLENGAWRFDFTRVERFIALCRQCDIANYEIAHLFTQWGAKHAPKIVVTDHGVQRKAFGWHTDAQGAEYQAFLRDYLRALVETLKRMQVFDHTYFHISDEPEPKDRESYLAALRIVRPHLAGAPVLDAMSDLRLYEQADGVTPVPASNYIQPFLDVELPRRWVYYCCGQYRGVGNHFIAMPSHRNRILGVQLYWHQMHGFLHWGYNFYNAQFSDYPIDPYACTDGDGFGPAGDAFIVYPGADGKPEDSIRSMVACMAFDDLRAFQWLEALTSRDTVVGIIKRHAGCTLDAFNVPAGSGDFLPGLRGEVNRKISLCLEERAL